MENAFLQAITEAPDDLVSRWAYADWLSEQQGPALLDRAEFLRAQFALADRALKGADRKRLAERQSELLLKYRAAWAQPFRDLVLSYEFRNGFAERVTLNCDQLFNGFTELIAKTPVVRVRLRGLTPATGAELASLPEMAHLRELVLERENVTGAALAALLRSPHLGRLRYLNLARNPLTDDGLRPLIGHDVFGQIRYLNLSYTGLTRAGVRDLVGAFAAGHGHGLQKLLLGGAPRHEPGREYPRLPGAVPPRLRQCIECQLGLPAPPRTPLLQELARTRTSLDAALRQWVDLLHTRKAGLATALAQLPLPDEVHRAFAAVCERRAAWRAHRTKTAPFLFGPEIDTSREELARAVNALVGVAGPERESAALTDCLLDLWLRHQRGDLPADGRTR